ncbi:hypothetical protein JTB14_010728 [Gonioctena quinquepunctata]|nr:hypothetical protein JTB14_010728 [Gonioctena quinquepunctata]
MIPPNPEVNIPPSQELGERGITVTNTVPTYTTTMSGMRISASQVAASNCHTLNVVAPSVAAPVRTQLSHSHQTIALAFTGSNLLYPVALKAYR